MIQNRNVHISVQLWGPNPCPILGKLDSENIPYFREISQFRAPEAARISKTYPILGKYHNSWHRKPELQKIP